MAESKGPEAAKLKSEKQRDIRETNIIAAQAVANVVRTSLGPCGMDKMVSSHSKPPYLPPRHTHDLEISFCALTKL